MAVDAKLLNLDNGDQPGARETEHCRLPQLWASDPDPFEKSPHCWRALLERLRRTIHPSLVGGVISRHRPALAALLLKCQKCATVD